MLGTRSCRAHWDDGREVLASLVLHPSFSLYSAFGGFGVPPCCGPFFFLRQKRRLFFLPVFSPSCGCWAACSWGWGFSCFGGCCRCGCCCGCCLGCCCSGGGPFLSCGASFFRSGLGPFLTGSFCLSRRCSCCLRSSCRFFSSARRCSSASFRSCCSSARRRSSISFFSLTAASRIPATSFLISSYISYS